MKKEYITKNLTKQEFKCRCGKPNCDAPEMDFDFVFRLQKLRDLFGVPIRILSGARCHEHNAAVGGVKTSLHLVGKAADIAYPDGFTSMEMIRLGEQSGMGGIGIAKSFVHYDSGPKGRRWVY
jgi:uncharacterized protein YcbK (DUF882 family)